MIAFTDSSRLIYGCVVFLLNLNTNQASFLLAKNRIINKQLESKSMPSMEFHAISFGVEVLIDTYKELTGPSCVVPISITGLELFTDSLVCLHWLNSHVNDFGKLRNLNVFVKNRLNNICEMCEASPITFSFCDGNVNPADEITRPLSYRSLMKCNYFNVDDFFRNHIVNDVLEVTIPNPRINVQGTNVNPTDVDVDGLMAFSLEKGKAQEHIISLKSHSSFHHIASVLKNVLKFINAVKLRMKEKYPNKYSHFQCWCDDDLYAEASYQLILRDQHINFP